MGKATPRRTPQHRQSNPRAVLRAARRRAAAAAARPESGARRDFLKGVSAAGAIVGLPAAAASPNVENPGRGRDRRLKGKVTLFFNLSHMQGAQTDHYLFMAGRKYPLERVQDAPDVLAKHRHSNAFLRFVADEKITHHAVDVAVPSDIVGLGYLSCNENFDSGTWEMTGTCVHIPSASHAQAYKQARVFTPRGPLPLSGKRRMYGAPAATTLKDLQDEGALIDPTSFAEAVVGVHPDILSVEPVSAAHIQVNYVSQDTNTQELGLFVLPGMGGAVPEGMSTLSGKPPCGTLTPLIDETTKKPYKKSDGKLNQYFPDWVPAVTQPAATAMGNVHPLIRDDPTLGIDVTPFNLNGSGPQPTPAQVTGKLWARHDGVATIELAPVAPATSGPKLVFTNRNVETGLAVTDPLFSSATDGRIQVTLDNVSNWFLRWLGVWVQFLDANGVVLKVNTLPADTYPAAPGPYPRPGDMPDAIFLGVVSPALTLMGIPIQPGGFSPTVNMPTTAHSMRIAYTGMGLSGSTPKDLSENIYDAGALMTMAFNYAMIGFFMGVGASNSSTVFKTITTFGGGAVAQAIVAFVGGIVNQTDFVQGLSTFTRGFLKVLFNAGTSKTLVAVAGAMAEDIAEGEVLDAVPVAGEIARAVAAAVGAIQLAQTSIEVAISPPAYVFDLVATHDLSVTFVAENGLPQPAPGFTLYYKVSYLFDNGTAHTQSAVNVVPGTTSFPITFFGIPYGGQVNISIGFYMRRSSTPAGQNDWCAGFATTGLTSNTVETVPSPAGLEGFPIAAIEIPIQSTTRYIHTRKTMLDAQGNHSWQSDSDGSHAPPYIPPPGDNAPSLGGFRSITVRQATSTQKGYVGYSWQASSSGVKGCGSGAPGQFDQIANLNTDLGNAQLGYVNSESSGLCGLDVGVRLGYHLLTHDSLNLYVDPNSNMIRQVDLDPPGFAGPGHSFGMLNNASTRCLLHPSGHIVSIDIASHKIETLKLPSTVQPDSVTKQFFLARTFSGMGTDAGRITSPAALAISPDGVILVLEEGGSSGNNRIQAFDLGGNPVPYFKNQNPPYFLELPVTKNNSYLDLAVEFSGYLYVLSVSMDGENTHRLDIYHPSQAGTNPICTTENINAAKLAVDFWRNVYSLNYEVLRLNGNIPSFTEPSVSLWVPPPPTP